MSARPFFKMMWLAAILALGACSQESKVATDPPGPAEQSESSSHSADPTTDLTATPIETTVSIQKIFLDTKELKTPTPAMLMNELPYVPVQPVFKSLGMNIGWDPEEQLLTLQDSEKTITLFIGENEAEVNELRFPLQAAAEEIDGTLQVPLHLVQDATGAAVYWDPYTSEVSIITRKFMNENNISRADLDEAIHEYLEDAAAKQKDSQSTESVEPQIEKKPKPLSI